MSTKMASAGGRVVADPRTEATFLELVEGLNAIIWEMDARTWEFTYVSPRAEEILGYPVERWLHEPNFWAEVVLHPEDRQWAVEFCVSCTGRSEDHDFEYRAVAADGGVVWLRDVVRVVRDEAGAARLLRGVMVDVTRERETQAALERQAEQLANSQRLAHIGSWEWDAAAERVTWSDELHRIHGLEPGGFEGTFEAYLERVHPEDRERVREVVAAAMAGGEPFDFEERIVRPDGEVRLLRSRGEAVRDAEGRVVGLNATCQDVTHARRTEEEATRALYDLVREQAARAEAETMRAHLHRLFLQVPASVAITRGPEHVFELANPPYVETAGGRALVGRPVREAFPELEGQGLVELLDQVYATGEAYVGDEVRVELDRRGRGVREEAYFNFVYQPLTDAEDEVYGIMVHAVEVTEQVRSRRLLEQNAEELRRLAADLERSNRELDQFAYVTSHDLKAPLRGIAHLSQWIEEDAGPALSDESREHLRLLRVRVNRMEALIDGILAYSRAGRARAAPEPVDTRALAAELVEMLDPLAACTIEVDEGLPTIRAERLPLQQVLQNLIGNAVKHARAEQPRIRVTGRLVDGCAEFAVSDNGPGIAAEYQDRIWGIFQTLEARDKVEGTGIGLALVKKIVETRGGRAWIESAPGAGATFRFTWPEAAEHEEEP